MIDAHEIMKILPANRMAGLFAAPACLMSEARHIENMAYCVLGLVKLNVHNTWIKSGNSSFPEALVRVITKPSQILEWEGKKTSIVLQSKRRPELEGMIISQAGLALRPINANATWPSVAKYTPSNEIEGSAASQAVEKIGMSRFGFDETISHLFPVLFAKLDIEVGDHFYSNIQVFTDYWIERWRNPWDHSRG